MPVVSRRSAAMIKKFEKGREQSLFSIVVSSIWVNPDKIA